MLDMLWLYYDKFSISNYSAILLSHVRCGKLDSWTESHMLVSWAAAEKTGSQRTQPESCYPARLYLLAFPGNEPIYCPTEYHNR